MAAHQNIIVSLELEVQGSPLFGGAGPTRVLEAGTVGLVGRITQPSYVDGARVYEFFPAGWSTTAAAAKNPQFKIVVVAETVVLPQFARLGSATEEPVVSVPIVEAGYARLRHVALSPRIGHLGVKCCLEYAAGLGTFEVRPIPDTRRPRGPFVGRLLAAAPAATRWTGPGPVADVEFFRQRNYDIAPTTARGSRR